MHKTGRIPALLLLLTALLTALTAAGAESLFPNTDELFYGTMPSLTEALGRYPDSEETAGRSAVERWTNITESHFNTFGVYLKEHGAVLQDYQVKGSVLSATIVKGRHSFGFEFDISARTATVTYPEGSCDGLLFRVKPIWNAAEAAEAAGQYVEAAKKYASLVRYEGMRQCYRDSDQRELLCWYAEGEARRAAQDWDGAVEAFTKAGSYSDAAAQVGATRYLEGETKRAAQDWDDAVEAFTQAGEYSDAAEQIKETHYQHAALLLQSGDADAALTVFNNIKGYKDVDSLLKNDKNLKAAAEAAVAAAAREAKMKPYKTAGSYVTFGTYPQKSSGNDQTPIEWLVLDYDAKNNRALLLSRYSLDAKPYNTNYTHITWEECTLRTWLNKDFLNKAFTSAQQTAILTTTVDNSKNQGYSDWSTNGGNNTQDKVFLLSYAEANKYLNVTYNDRENTKSRVAPTDYAQKAGAFASSSNKTADGSAAGWWWLRSPGYFLDYAAYVSFRGALEYSNVNNTNACIRPAFWLNLSADIF